MPNFISTSRAPYIVRGDRNFKLADSSPENFLPREFMREIALATRIPEIAELEGYYVEAVALFYIRICYLVYARVVTPCQL